MAKKNVNLYCFECDIDFTVKFSEDDALMDPEYCPFCGEAIEIDDGDPTGEDEEENEGIDPWG